MIPESLSPIANHLWQSALFAGAAWLLTLALRKNSARVRHWVWVAAALKFLVPFSLLIALGSFAPLRTVVVPTPTHFSNVMEQVSQPFTLTTVSSPMLATVPTAPSAIPAILLVIWACGFIGISISWLIRWRRVRSAVHAGSPVELGLPIRVISSPSFLEPGIFGVFRPVLLLPDGIFDQLTPDQWKSVVAHELCHVRHRDNLIGVIQMFVEAVFWFNPLVWWIGKRIFQERELACDEEVLRLGSESRVYAQSILRVCELYLESPVECVAGVSGSNLRRRIEGIMTNQIVRKLNGGRKLLLAGVGTLAVAVPIGIGVMNAPAVRAQSQPAAATPRFEVASIKRNLSGRAGWDGFKISRGSFTVANASVQMLMEGAFHLQKARISGGPAWFASDRFDINAKGDPNASRQQVLQMLQSLLMDRLMLVMHRETKDFPIYALVPLKKGSSKLRKPKEGVCAAQTEPRADPRTPPDQVDFMQSIPCGGVAAVGSPQGGFLWGKSVSLSSIADALSNLTDRPVVDRTGLSGAFEFELRWMSEGAQLPHDENERPQDTSPSTEAPSSIFVAVQEQLGLKLEPTKGPVEILVIDHLERPSDN